MAEDAVDAVEVVKTRNEFYRDNHRRVMVILLLSLGMVAVLGSALTYLITHPPEPKYFAINSDGRLIKLQPLSEPNLSPSALLQWANVAAIASYTYNYVNYRQELQAASEFFTPEGWQQFLQALRDSNNLNAVIEKKLIVSAVATGAPIVLQEGLLNGRYTWRVQMPMLITYQSASQVSTQSVIVNMLITRVSPLYSAKGIGIAQFVVTSSSGTL